MRCLASAEGSSQEKDALNLHGSGWWVPQPSGGDLGSHRKRPPQGYSLLSCLTSPGLVIVKLQVLVTRKHHSPVCERFTFLSRPSYLSRFQMCFIEGWGGKWIHKLM